MRESHIIGRECLTFVTFIENGNNVATRSCFFFYKCDDLSVLIVERFAPVKNGENQLGILYRGERTVNAYFLYGITRFAIPAVSTIFRLIP